MDLACVVEPDPHQIGPVLRHRPSIQNFELLCCGIFLRALLDFQVYIGHAQSELVMPLVLET